MRTRWKLMVTLGWVAVVSVLGAWLARPRAVPDHERIPGRVIGEFNPDTRELREALAGIDRERLIVLDERDGRPIYALVVNGEDAESTWRVLRARVPQTGRWPVVIGGAEDVSLLLEMEELADVPIRSILAQASTIDATAWLAERSADLEAEFGSARDEWPASGSIPPTSSSTIGRDVLTGEPFAEVAIALVPTADGAEAPAWLTFGDYDECPPPAVHVAVLRHWHARHGAVVYGLTGEVLEAVVERPPSDRAAAIALAEEQYAYDADIVLQGAGSVDALAASLLGARGWFFWWD